MKKLFLCMLLLALLLVNGCGGSHTSGGASDSADSGQSDSDDGTVSGGSTEDTGARDNTPVVLTPTADGTVVYENDVAAIDVSNAEEGYVMVSYTGDNEKVKLQITGSDNVTYTYNLSGGYETFPLSCGSGSYTIAVFENMYDNQYSTCLSQTVDVTITNEFGPFLYPNQYIMFDADSTAVTKGAKLAASADTDLDVVSAVYNYVVDSISYDHELAEDLPSGYIPDPDTTYETGTGICLDYASLMTCMLRSQGIPTHLEVGYAGEAYHAWISTYITDVGWVNGIIEFDGSNWQLMDPTFAANSSESSLKKFIGDNTNYVTKYVY